MQDYSDPRCPPSYTPNDVYPPSYQPDLRHQSAQYSAQFYDQYNPAYNGQPEITFMPQMGQQPPSSMQNLQGR
ncbi:hypothetical protein CC1G_15215 [Coprinopsis cinerea okayama7|uniref:Uncharacterized protein n=1 Tax=Coprinopsis cinerea (strain Okayama-7 / 130 / ATCC MYA-4618 / FGSC 9003) TaxID=240176 RepID=D6RPK0_COPC7|nr:hypothetical protein CC1G_15215 [Coprinopsis cinerea okayama7\|eukprot:XP_002910580.1 hypothetical protein CC1G_15215 [Coprinopsis cinerea okayama7\